MKSSTRSREASTAGGARAAHRARLYHRLQLAAHLAKKQADREMTARTGLSVSQVAVLHVIASAAGTTQREVATELGINESAVTAMIRRLEESGHLTRSVEGRARQLALTAHGKDVVKAARPAFTPVNRALAGDLTGAEVDELAAALDAIIERLG